MKTKIIPFNYFELELPLKFLRSCYHQGQCDQDVEDVLPHCLPYLAKIPDDQLIKELSDYGAWAPEELQDRNENNKRIIWLAAGDYFDRK